MKSETAIQLSALFQKMKTLKANDNGFYDLRSLINEMINCIEKDPNPSEILLKWLKHDKSELERYKFGNNRSYNEEIISEFKRHLQSDLERAGVLIV
ncbi:MAG: hypothetical protein KGZ74_18570 [Chitinophagaceae bacterium]|nr:hypothetical protein [Chitinophagaceae bacterium]